MSLANRNGNGTRRREKLLTLVSLDRGPEDLDVEGYGFADREPAPRPH